MNEKQQGLILTREAPAKLAAIHARMPLLLTREQVRTWLSQKEFSHISGSAVTRFDTNIIEFHEVSLKVNSASNDAINLTDKIM